MISSSESLSPSNSESRAPRHDATERVPKAVKEAQLEMQHLIASLADDAGHSDAGWSASHSVEPTEDTGYRAGSAHVHLIISSKRALEEKYGRSGFEQLDYDLRDLRQAIEAQTDMEVVIAYVDEEPSLRRFGLQPVDAANPWRVKKLVDAVDAKLAEHGRQIRHLLIIGGDRIIPFHRLPNPVDDQDLDVPSDNPYACRDANYLIPERAIGRMPDGETDGVGFLHTLIQTAAEAHRRRAISKGLISTVGAVLDRMRRTRPNGHGLGYSASIWRKASRAVFEVIGDDGHLRTSPPLTYEAFQVRDPPRFSYFNLHGIEDGPNWYGQRDALFPADYPIFPLALRPEDASVSKHADAVVFTEACYGANILGKDEANSIALRFMAGRALAVVGSTKVSYGSIAPPLLGADLIGRRFWEGLQAHLTVGQALRHAKLTMANEMQQRQGYLDDEDQKTLISFVLFGDPSLPISSIHRSAPVQTSSELFCPSVICSRRVDPPKGIASDELLSSVKARVEANLPHMSHARVRARPLAFCTETCEKGCGLLNEQARRSGRPSLQHKALTGDGRRWALTLAKEIEIRGDGAHHQVVKVVADEHGRILKIAVSK